MTKYRLKKDTPFYKKGTEFCEDWFHKGVLLNDDCNAVANLNELDNPDEWFEMATDDEAFCLSVERCTSIADDGFVPATNVKFPNDRQEQRNKFTDYLEAVATVSQDEGFMKDDFQGSGYCMRLHFVDADEVVFDRVAYVRTLRYAGAFFFDTEEHAKQSIIEHRASWQTILNYDWSRE